jgi:hypothetical protein
MNVVWYNKCFGNWDHGLISSIFDKHPDKFEQHNLAVSPEFERAIVVVAGRPDVTELRQYLNKMQSGVVILTSEEDSFFDWKAAIPEHLEVWTQYYSPNKSEIKTRLLLGAPTRLRDFKINTHLPKKYLWSFVGQVQNESRQACVNVLRNLPDGYLQEVQWFGGQGDGAVEYQNYLDIMCQSKYVICPSGSMSVDSFRLYEAIECGAIPITEIKSPRDPAWFNYWLECYPENSIIKVTEWAELKARFENEIQPHPSVMNEWWTDYKQDLENKLLGYV